MTAYVQGMVKGKLYAPSKRGKKCIPKQKYLVLSQHASMQIGSDMTG